MGIRSSRRLAGGFGLAAVACAGALAVATPAGAATVSYPAGGSDFAGDSDGWVGSDAACGPLNPLSLLCSASTPHDAAVGNPDGSISVQINVTLNLLGLWTGTGTWTSPAFTPQPSGPVTGAGFAYDRRVDSGGGIDLTPSSVVTVTLVDDTAGTSTPVLTDNLTSDANGAFAAREVALPAGAVVAGHSYRLRIATTTSSSLIGLLGQANTRFDNVRLSVTDGASTGGPGLDSGDSPEVSDGVQVLTRTVGDSQIASLISRYGIESEAGNGEGGSLIPRSECTIVGTPGPDRIAGTAANEVICGLGGNDVILGGGGRDAIDGGDGADRLSGGAGGDLLLGLRGNDRASGGGAADAIGGGAGKDRLSGGAGKDRVSGRSGADRVAGNGGGDRLAGGAGRDRLTGGRGGDRIAGGAAADRIFARDRRRDRVFGGPGRDTASVDVATGSRRSARWADRVRGVERLR